jgi:hypothetical protein
MALCVAHQFSGWLSTKKIALKNARMRYSRHFLWTTNLKINLKSQVLSSDRLELVYYGSSL